MKLHCTYDEEDYAEFVIADHIPVRDSLLIVTIETVGKTAGDRNKTMQVDLSLDQALMLSKYLEEEVTKVKRRAIERMITGESA